MARSIETFLRDLDTGVKKAFYKKTMREIGEIAIEAIVQRTQDGYGVQKTGYMKRRLKPLSDSYLAYRSRYRNKLDSTTSINTSNLTFTGRMLRSMKVKEVSNNRVTWGPSRDRRAGGVSNEDIGNYVSEQGRPFNFLAKEDIAKIEQRVDKILQDEIRRV